jgi:hypothetical protein
MCNVRPLILVTCTTETVSRITLLAQTATAMAMTTESADVTRDTDANAS